MSCRNGLVRRLFVFNASGSHCDQTGQWPKSRKQHKSPTTDFTNHTDKDTRASRRARPEVGKAGQFSASSYPCDPCDPWFRAFFRICRWTRLTNSSKRARSGPLRAMSLPGPDAGGRSNGAGRGQSPPHPAQTRPPAERAIPRSPGPLPLPTSRSKDLIDSAGSSRRCQPV